MRYLLFTALFATPFRGSSRKPCGPSGSVRCLIPFCYLFWSNYFLWCFKKKVTTDRSTSFCIVDPGPEKNYGCTLFFELFFGFRTFRLGRRMTSCEGGVGVMQWVVYDVMQVCWCVCFKSLNFRSGSQLHLFNNNFWVENHKYIGVDEPVGNIPFVII